MILAFESKKIIYTEYTFQGEFAFVMANIGLIQEMVRVVGCVEIIG